MRPTIALACILKNEKRNIPQLLDSVKGCFDEIHFTDTGSTDGSIELIQELQRTSSENIKLHHFTWIDDFSAARNASFSHPTTDYIMWMDLDDVMSDAAQFIQFRDTVMAIADYWIATYHYASDAKGHPVCSFARERVIKRSIGLKWQYFVHEGIHPGSTFKKDMSIQYATNWSIVHKRTDEDAKQDKSRNLKLFKDKEKDLDPRMRYYYGKELFENKMPLEAFPQLVSASAEVTLEPHDRTMAIQYACLCAMQTNQLDRAINLAYNGLQLEPGRAEFFVIVGDCYAKMNKAQEAIPFYKAASSCSFAANSMIQGAIFKNEDSYTHYPLNQLARIYANFGDMEKAEEYAALAIKAKDNAESPEIIKEIKALKDKAGVTYKGPRADTEDVVFACLPNGPYEWDEDIYREVGIGGSETACVEMARWISDLTGRKVLIFNNRKITRTYGKVEYRPAEDLPMYYAKNKPKVNINWRHNIRFAENRTFVWCHDLTAAMAEIHTQYEKIFALSEFHANFLSSMCRVPREKIWVTSNGINPLRFKEKLADKIPGRLIWSSSPDRGLDGAILAMDEIVKEIPNAELHCFYGFDNMKKMGKDAEIEKLQALISSRPYIRYVGNIPQNQLAVEMAKAEVWLYPTNFLETHCITALEAICSHTYPVVRKWGGLQNTLAKAQEAGMASVLDTDNVQDFAKEAVAALKGKYWERVNVNPDDYSWEKVAKSWIEFMGL